MKNLGTPEATFNIAEKDDYSACFARGGRELNLWKVSVQVPMEIFVLAEDEDLAINQAHTIAGLSSEQRSGVSSAATQVPFGIRGWGRSQF